MSEHHSYAYVRGDEFTIWIGDAGKRAMARVVHANPGHTMAVNVHTEQGVERIDLDRFPGVPPLVHRERIEGRDLAQWRTETNLPVYIYPSGRPFA